MHSSQEEIKGNHRHTLLSRSDIEAEYGITRRWLELAALVPDKGPPMIRVSRKMIRYQRGAFEDWLVARTVTSTSQEVDTV